MAHVNGNGDGGFPTSQSIAREVVDLLEERMRGSQLEVTAAACFATCRGLNLVKGATGAFGCNRKELDGVRVGKEARAEGEGS